MVQVDSSSALLMLMGWVHVPYCRIFRPGGFCVLLSHFNRQVIQKDAAMASLRSSHGWNGLTNKIRPL